MPLISIIIPTYNYGHFLEEAVNSVINQTYTNWECIIVDDGSTDNTAYVVSNIIINNPQYQIKYFYIDNSGTAAAKNVGLDKSAGELIQFLDADDSLECEKFTNQLVTMFKSNADLVFSDSKFYYLDINGERIFFDKFPAGYLLNESLSGYNLLKKIIQNNVFTISSPLFKKELVPDEKFVPDLRHNEDWLFWIKVANRCSNFVYDNQRGNLSLIRAHSVSAMQGSKNMFRGELIVRQEIDNMLKSDALLTVNDNQRHELVYYNNSLLILHQIRSLDAITGFKMIALMILDGEMKAVKILPKGIFKLLVRWYKLVVNYAKK